MFQYNFTPGVKAIDTKLCVHKSKSLKHTTCKEFAHTCFFNGELRPDSRRGMLIKLAADFFNVLCDFTVPKKLYGPADYVTKNRESHIKKIPYIVDIEKS